MSGLLGFDTSTGELTVAVVAGEAVLAEREEAPDPDGRPRHARSLLAAIEAAVARSGGWASIDAIAVGLGPGTFTGLRIGVTTARALAQARGLRVAGVSSLAALARGAVAAQSEDGDDARTVLAVLDAKRGEAFASLHEPGGAQSWPPWVGSPDALAQRIAELPAAPVAVGEGAVAFRERLEAAGAVVPPEADPSHRLRARHVCLLAAAVGARPPQEIEPTYLRRPDAELWRERDRGPSITS